MAAEQTCSAAFFVLMLTKRVTVSVPLAEANEALDRLRRGDLTGALVLVP